MNILRPILDVLFPPRKEEIAVRKINDPRTLVNVALLSRLHLSVTGLMEFEEPQVRALIHEAKYHNNALAHALLAEVLSDYLLEYQETYALEVLPIVVVPIPLSPNKRRRRGYNQVEEVLRRASLPAGWSIDRSTLKKERDTESQTKLGKVERMKNLNDAFVAGTCGARARYLIIDDVVTTGATLAAARSALRAAGARSVDLLALAY